MLRKSTPLYNCGHLLVIFKIAEKSFFFNLARKRFEIWRENHSKFGAKIIRNLARKSFEIWRENHFKFGAKNHSKFGAKKTALPV
jgi:hypothetical protein